jgi:hypothetical protein
LALPDFDAWGHYRLTGRSCSCAESNRDRGQVEISIVLDNPTNINARIDDGVLSISQYNPATDWGTTISGIRSQLNAPLACP